MADMMPPNMIHRAGMKRIVGSGGGLCRNPILKTQVLQKKNYCLHCVMKAYTLCVCIKISFNIFSQVQEIYKLPIEFAPEANACIGAALAVISNPIYPFVKRVPTPSTMEQQKDMSSNEGTSNLQD